jgi:restriction system protein
VLRPEIPEYHQLMWPALVALRELGGSATMGEMYEQMVRDQGFSEEQQAVLTKDGRTSEINYRLHWARTHLKSIGAIDNSQRGVWSLTDKGKSLTPEQMKQDTKAYRDRITAPQKQGDAPAMSRAVGRRGVRGLEGPAGGAAALLVPCRLRTPGPATVAGGRLRQRHRGGQERRRRDRRHGPLPLVAGLLPRLLPVQALRGDSDRRGGTGLLGGHGRPRDKGLLVTTGTFTREAQSEASRDGAPPVELIDGDRLCELLREHQLGVRVEHREEVVIDLAFFENGSVSLPR